MYTSKEMHRFTYLVGETDNTYHELALKVGLSDSAMLILYTLCDMGGTCSLQTICSYSGLTKQTINSSIRKLESENIIEIRKENGKNKKVILTDKGHEYAKNTVLKIIKIENEIMDSWSKEEVEQYLFLTEKYLGMLRDKMKEM